MKNNCKRRGRGLVALRKRLGQVKYNLHLDKVRGHWPNTITYSGPTGRII